MKIKPRGKIYSINEGYESQWDEAVKKYVHSKKFPQVSTSFSIDSAAVMFCLLSNLSVLITQNRTITQIFLLQNGKAYGARYVGSMVSENRIFVNDRK